MKQPADAKIIATLSAKKAIAANELYYRCECDKDFFIDNGPLCTAKAPSS